jgi:acetyl esterase/lipase
MTAPSMHPLGRSANRVSSACSIAPRSQCTPARRRFDPQLSDCLEERSLLSVFVPAARAAGHSVRPTETTRPISPRLEAVAPEAQNVSFPTVDGQYEQLDVYEPTSSVPAGGRPVMIAIHGGGWRRFNKTGFGERIASAFVSQGYVVVAPNYVLSAPDVPSWPMNLEDVQAAVRWVRTNAVALDLDPNEITAIGESAGANLAALLGTYSPGAGLAAVDSVIALSTPTSLAVLYDQSPLAGLAVKQFLGGTPAQVPASYAAASPIDHVAPGDPPMLLVQGRQDPLIPMSQSVAMAHALAAAGVPHQLILVNGGHKLDFPDHYVDLIPQMLEFLQET